MKKFFITLFVSLLVFIGYNTLKNVPAYDPYSWTKHKLIAHAGGGIDDKIYTNSLDAFKENYQKGFRLFEFDIAITSDNKLVARHGRDGTTFTLLNEITTPAWTQGQTANIEIVVNASQITVKRDTLSFTVNDTRYRNGYLHLGRRVSGVLFNDIYLFK